MTISTGKLVFAVQVSILGTDEVAFESKISVGLIGLLKLHFYPTNVSLGGELAFFLSRVNVCDVIRKSSGAVWTIRSNLLRRLAATCLSFRKVLFFLKSVLSRQFGQAQCPLMGVKTDWGKPWCFNFFLNLNQCTEGMFTGSRIF